MNTIINYVSSNSDYAHMCGEVKAKEPNLNLPLLVIALLPFRLQGEIVDFDLHQRVVQLELT